MPAIFPTLTNFLDINHGVYLLKKKKEEKRLIYKDNLNNKTSFLIALKEITSDEKIKRRK